MANEFVTRNGFISKADSIITGSLTTTGGLTGSILSASYSLTASYSQNAQTASFVTTAISASYSTVAITASYAITASVNMDISYDPSQLVTQGLSYISPNWCFAEVTGSYTSVPGLNNIILTPVFIHKTCTLNSLGLTFASTASGVTTTARLGIYTDSGNMLPLSLSQDLAFLTSSVTTSQFMEMSSAPVNSVILNAKTIYWVAVVGDAALKLPVPRTANSLYNPLLQVELSASAVVASVYPIVKNISSYGYVSASAVNGLPATLPQTAASYVVNSYFTSSAYIGPILKVTY